MCRAVGLDVLVQFVHVRVRVRVHTVVYALYGKAHKYNLFLS